MRRFLVILTLIFALAAMPSMSNAADIGPLFTTPLLGTSIGAMAGILVSQFSSHPADHYNDYMGIGAGVGFVCGLALGVSDVMGASASLYQQDTTRERLFGFTINIPLK